MLTERYFYRKEVESRKKVEKLRRIELKYAIEQKLLKRS